MVAVDNLGVPCELRPTDSYLVLSFQVVLGAWFSDLAGAFVSYSLSRALVLLRK